MIIKLHNSLGKISNKENETFIFDDKTHFYISRSIEKVFFTYLVDDYNYFLTFLYRTKKFEEYIGFGANDKSTNPNWWKKEIWEEI